MEAYPILRIQIELWLMDQFPILSFKVTSIIRISRGSEEVKIVTHRIHWFQPLQVNWTNPRKIRKEIEFLFLPKLIKSKENNKGLQGLLLLAKAVQRPGRMITSNLIMMMTQQIWQLRSPTFRENSHHSPNLKLKFKTIRDTQCCIPSQMKKLVDRLMLT